MKNTLILLTAFLFISLQGNTQVEIAVLNVTKGNVNCIRDKGFIILNEIGGGKPPYTYQWSNGATTKDISNLDLGVYSLVIHDSNNPPFVGNENYEIKADTLHPIANAGPDKQLSCSITQVVLNATGSSPLSVAQSYWSTPNGYVSNTFPYPNAIAKAPGLYILKTERSNTGCVDYDTVLVTQTLDMPIANAGPPQILYCTNPEIKLDGSGSSTGIPGYAYFWKKLLSTGIVSGEDTPIATVDQPGNYLLKVTNQATGCFTITSVDVLEDVNKPKAYFDQQPVHINCEHNPLPLHLTVEPFGGTFTYQWGIWGVPVGHIVSGQGTPDIVVDSSGNYTVKVTNTQNGCTDFESWGVDYFFETPIVSAGSDVFLGCDNTTIPILNAINLPGSTPDLENSYYWYDELGNWLNPYKESGIYALHGGRYIVKSVHFLSKCFDTDTVYVLSSDHYAQVANKYDTLNCATPIVTLDALASASGNGFILQWATLNGHILGNPTTPIIQVDSIGYYSLIISDTIHGCSDTTFAFVFANYTPPAVEVVSEQVLPCNPNAVHLHGNGSALGSVYQYNWSTPNGNIVSGAQGLNPVVDKVGTYTLSVLDNRNGCTASLNTMVVEPNEFFVEAEATACTCYGIDDGRILGLAPSDVLWALNGDDFSLNPDFDNLGSGEYLVQAKDSFGCVKTLNLWVSEPASIWVELGADFAVEASNDTILQFDSNIPDGFLSSIEWQEDGFSLCQGCEVLPIAPVKESIYNVFLTDKNGCVASDVLKVKILDASIYVPNAFSPNSSHSNTRFMLYSNNNALLIKSFQVYSRWGELIYERSNLLPNTESEGWDGTFKGKLVQEGVYIWTAVIQQEDKEAKHYSGDILLIQTH